MINYNETIKSLLYFGFVKKILEDVRDNGVGDRCLYFTIFPKFPGVTIPEFYRDEDTVTIVLENEFTDLMIRTSGFSVTIFFEEIEDERKIFIPYESIAIFADPHYDFWIRFDQLVTIEDENFLDEEFLKKSNLKIKDSENIISIDFKNKND